jgi:hypothetical protein
MLIACASTIAFGHLGMDLLGARPYASLLSGTLPPGARDLELSYAICGAQTAAYLASVLVAPILAIAGALLLLADRAKRSVRP